MVKLRPLLTLADLADMPPEWLIPFCEGSPTTKRHIAQFRHDRDHHHKAGELEG